MPRRRIGQEELFSTCGRRSSLDDLLTLIDWSEIDATLVPVHASAKGEASWPPLAMFRALLLSVWYDLSDVKLAEALDDRASFRRVSWVLAHRGQPRADSLRSISPCAAGAWA
jgi:IS5 family transposase